jgi:hypothetical protein
MVGGATASTAAGGAISAASQLEAGDIQHDAAEKALAQQLQTTQKATDTFNPLTSTIAPVAGGLENLLGVGPQGSAGMLSQLQATPGYQFALDQGLQATQSGFAAQGLAKSGAALKGAANYAEGLAGTTYQNMVSNFMNGGTLGLNAATQQAGTALSGQNSANNLILNSGAAKASGIVGAANVLNGTIGNINALNPNNYGGGTTPGTSSGMYDSGMVDRLAANGNATTTNDLALQNPYQIQAPAIQPGAINVNDNAFAIPSLPTG